MISADDLKQVMGCTTLLAMKWLAPLNAAMEKYEINTAVRIGAFIAQVGHESGRLQFVREIWNPKQCPWQLRYEGRADLGNTQPGDGFKFRGRGLIQITGRKNYRLCGAALGIPLENKPELLEIPEYAAMSSGWFWVQGAGLNLSNTAKARLGEGCNLNLIADKGDFEGITLAVNGGTNGWADRLALYNKAEEVLA